MSAGSTPARATGKNIIRRLGIGSTNRLGEVPQDRPVHYQNVFATLYRQLGLDPETTTIPDFAGRPQYLLDIHEPISELI